MRDGTLAGFGSNGGAVEVDETFFGKELGVKKHKKARSVHHKMKMLTLVDRESGRTKSVVIDDMKKSTLIPILRENIAKEATVFTDAAKLSNNFADHDCTTHSAGAYFKRDEPEVHTNTAEIAHSGTDPLGFRAWRHDERLRLAGIKAPGKGEEGYAGAAEALSRWVSGKDVYISTVNAKRGDDEARRGFGRY